MQSLNHGPRKKANSFVRVIYISLIFLMVSPLSLGRAAPNLQNDTASERAQALLQGLTPEERVGQLFLVGFQGTDAGPDSQIYDLITHHHIGGVILTAENDNFEAQPQTLTGIVKLIRQLQNDEWSATQSTQVNPGTNEEFTPAFIPLLIGVSQEGDGAPYDQIINGLTPLPSQMAIGATWQSDLARQVGAVLGKELSDLGFNLLLGPSLDVLDTPHTQGAGDLGIRTFGGDPFWVGEMGRAYVSGVHEGSADKIAVVGAHFPGHGSSDRLPEEEVATVRKSLEQLKLNELPPFEAVTGNAPSPEATVDALLASHIRYQGFQGNIRETTRPVSFDPQAFSQLMELPAFSAWRDAGGVMITDDLGSRAFRRFIDPGGNDFNARSIAREAFLTGNDILYLGTGFVGTSDADSYQTILGTLDSFTKKYNEDPNFEKLVDAAVLRILTLKYRLYDNLFIRGQVLVTNEKISEVGKSSQVTFEVAQQAATLINPSLASLADTLPEPPTLNDRVVFVTDAREAKQCSQCPEQPMLAKDALEKAVVRLYGPLNAGLVLQRNLESYSFAELLAFLDNTDTVDLPEMENTFQQADWIVFAMLNVSTNSPSSQALSRFLAERPGLFRQKKLIVFAFNAPYFLDSTEISKITAYYGLYSKTPQFVEVAARLLFGELPTPPGDPPVSVPGISYDLISATAPDPGQTIPLFWDRPQTGAGTPQPTIVAEYKVGDLVAVRTGIIEDHNGHPVPDGTPVQFILSGGNKTDAEIQNASTSKGIALATLLIDRSGSVEISVQSDPARESNPLNIDVPPEPEDIAGLTATASPTETPTLTPSPTSTASPVAASSAPSSDHPNWGDWFLALFVTGGIGVAIYWLTTQFGLTRWGIRGGILALIGGLLAYTYLSLGMPGSIELLQNTGSGGVALVTILGSILGGGAAYGWAISSK
ncbi:MAG TPA: glycoside hydrolase family 3 N-terminal domain-containing protein [Anaerolineales bacterium]|nr:glycoside hydrolase family 3 N-terminal domain-containing protein [Anaerolineales bacterium]